MTPLQYLRFILAVLLLELFNCRSASGQHAIRSILQFLRDGQQLQDSEPKETQQLHKVYDFIIVGAGSAGCVLANRLTEVKDWNVLLIEAGGSENFVMDIPILTTLLQFTQANWNYRTEPQPSGCLGMQDGRCRWPRGKVMGGSSVLHHMIHTRGNRRDYDTWEALGNKGWGYDQVLEYFKKSEDMDIEELANDTKYHNKGGHLTISYAPWKTKLAEAFIEAGRELGLPYVDYNGESQIGFSYTQTTQRNGTRLSTSRAFLHPIADRDNLHVRKLSHVTRVLIDPDTKRAYGVEFVKNNRRYQVRVEKEVILSAGAINTPQLLMLSGVGPRNHLKKFKIPNIVSSKVGYNLQDHMALGGLTFVVNDTVSLKGNRLIDNPEDIFQYFASHNGPLSDPAGSEALAFLDTRNPNSTSGYPDVELLFVGGSFVSFHVFKHAFGISDQVYDHVYKSIEDKDTWMVFPMIMLPKSRGRIMLKNANPFQKPLIYPNYFSDPDDLEVVLRGIKKVIELSKTKAFQRYDSRLHDVPLPGCKHHKFASDDYWKCAIKYITITIYHHTGTCKMGPKNDKDAVVDPRLRVYGVTGLRVADASIMPFVPTAHTNGPTVMIGEKASDLIKEDWNRL